MSLSWINNAWNDTGLIVERADNGGSFQTIAQLPAGSIDFVDVAAPHSARLVYRIRATNVVASSYASTAAASTGPSPLVLWGDAAYTGGTPDGTEINPYRTFLEGYGRAAIQTPTILNLRSGQYEFGLPMEKPLRLVPQGGSVLIEKP